MRFFQRRSYEPNVYQSRKNMFPCDCDTIRVSLHKDGEHLLRVINGDEALCVMFSQGALRQMCAEIINKLDQWEETNAK